jgi:carbonic anhydrase/acetyltransferase-like protein (isoleucine patch superfamily)
MKISPMRSARALCSSLAIVAALVTIAGCSIGEARGAERTSHQSLFALDSSLPTEGRAEQGAATDVHGDAPVTYEVSAPKAKRRAPANAAHDDVESPVGATVPRGLERLNVVTDFSPEPSAPRLDPTVFLDPLASVIGAVEIGHRVYIAPFASLRGDEGQPIHLGNETNVQDGVVIHALETIVDGVGQLQNTVEVDGARYAVYIGNRVSLAHQSQVHGPAWIEDGVFVGMKSLVFKAHIGRGVVIEPTANVIGVTVPAGRYVKAGTTVTDQATADALPVITDTYAFRSLNDAVVHVNTSFADVYAGKKPAPAPAGKPAPHHPK